MAYSDVILGTSGLVHYYRLGETSGTTLADSKGTESLTVSGGYTLNSAGAIAGDGSGALDLSGTNASAITNTHTAVGGGDFTYEFWLKFNHASANVFFISEGSSASATPLVSCGISASSGGKLRIFVRSMTTFGDVSTTGNYNDNLWHYVVMTGKLSTSTLSLYIDKTDAPIITATYPSGSFGTLDRFSVGSLYRTANGNYGKGIMDEVAIYNTVLSSATMAQHYAAAVQSRSGFFMG